MFRKYTSSKKNTSSKKKYIKKLKYTKRKNNKTLKGGQLIMSETDLKNTHICKPSEKDKGKYKESPGFEVYTAISDAFCLNKASSGYFLTNFKKEDNKWFKFTIFNNSGQHYVYIINGTPINKHSICMLQGLLDVTKDTGEYAELREAYNKVIELKSVHGIDTHALEENPLVQSLNATIAKDIPCMPVISAGSGTVNENGIICINTKSGHYKPSLESMELAKSLFTEITEREIVIVLKEDKEAIKAKYGVHYEQFSGICL